LVALRPICSPRSWSPLAATRLSNSICLAWRMLDSQLESGELYFF
jgi:hypothetical protein